MGSDQSHGAGSGAAAPPLKSQRDEDIPYTSCSISKPIGSDVPSRTSPRLKSKSTSRDPRDASTKNDIVVVAEGVSAATGVDPETLRLEAIPAFLPLLRSATITERGVGGATDWEGGASGGLDARRLLGLCLRYQEHLKQCAESVSFDQNAISVRIKEVDFLVQTLYTSLTERQKRFSRYAEQIQKVQEMSNTLSRVQMSFDQIVPLMERLNAVLPVDEQLEPFCVVTMATK